LPLPRIEPRFPENPARILLSVIPCYDILHSYTHGLGCINANSVTPAALTRKGSGNLEI